MIIAAGLRSGLALPLIFQDQLLGVFSIFRPFPGEFSAHLIELLQSFADQTAVALHNARQHHETEQPNRALTEALEEQTAMAEVLQVISRSPADLPSVLQTVIERAVRRMGEEAAATIWLREGDTVPAGRQGRTVAERRARTARW
ncbi:MAG: GAF domain-containing protein [Dehalococcoidia bacterium]